MRRSIHSVTKTIPLHFSDGGCRNGKHTGCSRLMSSWHATRPHYQPTHRQLYPVPIYVINTRIPESFLACHRCLGAAYLHQPLMLLEFCMLPQATQATFTKRPPRASSSQWRTRLAPRRDSYALEQTSSTSVTLRIDLLCGVVQTKSSSHL